MGGKKEFYVSYYQKKIASENSYPRFLKYFADGNSDSKNKEHAPPP